MRGAVLRATVLRATVLRATVLTGTVALALMLGSMTSPAAATTITPAAAAGKPSVWAQNDGNAAASRANANETVLNPSTVTGLTRRRGLTVAPAPGDNPCGYRGIDLVAASATVDYVEGDGHLVAYDAATGRARWRVVVNRYFDTYYPSIAVTHGLVILGAVDCISQSDPNGSLQAFDAATGKAVWTRGVGSELDSMVVSGPYLVETGSSLGSGQVTSVRRATTGARLWQKFGSACYSYGSTPVVVVGQQVVTHTCDPDTGAMSLTAYRLGTGRLSWTRAIDWSIERGDSGAPGARHLLVRDDYGDVADLDPATGVTRYLLAGATSVLAVDASRVYAKCGPASVCAFALSTGVALWSRTDSSGLATEAGGVLYLGDGRMLDAATGARLARLFPTGSASILIVAGGRVGVLTWARTLSLYGLAGS